MILYIVLFCIFLGVYTSIGLGPWIALLASFVSMAVLGFAIMGIFALFTKD